MNVRQSACYLRAIRINAKLLRQVRYRSSDMYIMYAMKTIRRCEYLRIQFRALSRQLIQPGRCNQHAISMFRITSNTDERD